MSADIEAVPGRHAPKSLVWLVIGLFFIWGGATSLNDILIPKLKRLFSLTYADVMLTQFAFFLAYFIVSVPAGTLVARIGYVRGLVVGLAVMAVGAALFRPAAGSGTYWSFLVALFVLVVGITILRVAANPLIAGLGDPAGASSRLTFAQMFNSLGTAVVAYIYIGLAVVVAVIAIIFWAQRKTLRSETPDEVGFFYSLRLLGMPRVRFGVIALFAYVGAEVSVFCYVLIATFGLFAARPAQAFCV